MKKTFCLSIIAMMTLLALSALTADVDEPNPQSDMALLANEEPAPNPLPPGEYWLGIQCHPVFPALQAQLHLPENQGIVVEGVVPDSPAAKAGLAKYDVILKVGDKQLSDVPDLLQAVDAAKDKEIKLEIIRDGQPKTIAITPAKRPEEYNVASVPPPGGSFEALQKWMEQMPGARFGGKLGPDGPMRFWSFRPGVILPPGAPVHPPLPGNMSIIISKTGDKPADIIVKMGDEKWEVTEKDLDKLPEKVRPFVDRMLGLAGPGAGAMHWTPEVLPPSFPQEPGPPPGPGGPGPGGPGLRLGPGPNTSGPPWNNLERRVEKRLEEMKQRIEKLENELTGRHQGDKTPETPQAGEKPQDKTSETPDKSAL